VRAVRGDSRGVLRVASSSRERAFGAGPGFGEGDPKDFRSERGDVREPASTTGTAGGGLGGEPEACRTVDARGWIAGAGGAGVSVESPAAPALRSASEPALGMPGEEARRHLGRGRDVLGGGAALVLPGGGAGPVLAARSRVEPEEGARVTADAGGLRLRVQAPPAWEADLPQRPRDRVRGAQLQGSAEGPGRTSEHDARWDPGGQRPRRVVLPLPESGRGSRGRVRERREPQVLRAALRALLQSPQATLVAGLSVTG